MGKKTLTKDRDSTWSIDGNGGNWTMTAGAAIKTMGEAGILEASIFGDNRIRVDGDIHALGGNCIRISGAGTDLVVGSQSMLKGYAGIFMDGENQVAVNNGVIRATGIGMTSSGVESRLVNNGSIFANVGITTVDDDAVIVNGKNGYIEGATAISTACDSSVKIVNAGTLGGKVAVIIGDGFTEIGTSHIVNTGKIIGTVYLGNGNDIFDTRKGVTTGTVVGGDGNDTFYVAKSTVAIYEAASAGSDTVVSSASFDLPADVENLTLVGGKNLRGDGSNVGNILNGNKGDNKLFGYGGVDLLNGKAGNDDLYGDNDGVLDLFIFNRGTGDDVIRGFEDGVDLVVLGNYEGIDGMEDFDIVAAGADTRLVLKDGDTVLIKGLLAVNFTNDDVAFSIF